MWYIIRFSAWVRVKSVVVFFFFKAEDGIRDLVRSRGLGDVYKRQEMYLSNMEPAMKPSEAFAKMAHGKIDRVSIDELEGRVTSCLLYTSDAADERSSVDLGGRRIIKKKKKIELRDWI